MEASKLLIPFSLINIEEKQFSTFDLPDVENGKMTQKAGFGFGSDPQKKVIACRCQYTLLLNAQPFITIQIVCLFKIEEKAWNEKLLEKEKVVLPQDFASHLASITASTTRGVLFANTKNTVHQKYPMALIDITNYIKEDISISL